MRPLPAPKSTENAHLLLFLCLACGAVLLFGCVLGMGWLVHFVGVAALHPWLAPVVGGLCLLLFFLSAGLVAGLAFAAHGRVWGRPHFWRRVLRVVAPVAEMLSRCLPFHSKSQSDTRPSALDRVRHAFIQCNNRLVLAENMHCSPDQLLILLPHCLQASHCPLRLTHSPDNCRRCGRCTLRDFLHLRDTLGVRLAIAPGGTIARRIVRRERPQVIVAVACERDLASGIQDTAPLPVFGVLNERPMGPCIDTHVAMDLVELAVMQFIGGRDPLKKGSLSPKHPSS